MRWTEQTDDDTRLVVAARSGDDEAFAMLVRRHESALRSAIARWEHDRERRADVAQDALLRAYVKLPSLRDPGRFRPWLVQIARSVVVDSVRMAKARPVEPLGERPLRAAVATEPEAAYAANELAAELGARWAALSSRDRRALALATQCDARPRLIADRLGVSQGAAKVIVHRARRRLLAR